MHHQQQIEKLQLQLHAKKYSLRKEIMENENQGWTRMSNLSCGRRHPTSILALPKCKKTLGTTKNSNRKYLKDKLPIKSRKIFVRQKLNSIKMQQRGNKPPMYPYETLLTPEQV